MVFKQIKQVCNLKESKAKGKFKRRKIRYIIKMLLHVIKKDLKSLYNSLAFYIIKKALFIFRKKKL
jgi:hypothetical protein